MAKGIILLISILGLFDCLGNAGQSVCINNQPDTGIQLLDTVRPAVDLTADTLYYSDTINITNPDPELPIRIRLIGWFRAQVGVTQTGDNTGPEIDQYLAAVGLDPGHPWCGALIGAGYLEFDLTIPKAAAWSPSWFPNAKIIPNEQAQVGDVGGIYFASLGRIAHVFVFDENPSRNSSFAITIEGNTNDDGGRMGHSVMRKKRSLNKIRSSANWIESDRPP